MTPSENTPMGFAPKPRSAQKLPHLHLNPSLHQNPLKTVGVFTGYGYLPSAASSLQGGSTWPSNFPSCYPFPWYFFSPVPRALTHPPEYLRRHLAQ